MDPITSGAVDIGIANISSDTLVSAASEIGRVGTWLQALGIIAILWIIFQIVSLVLTLNKIKILNKVMDDLRRIELKIDRKLNMIDKKLGRRR